MQDVSVKMSVLALIMTFWVVINISEERVLWDVSGPQKKAVMVD